MGDLAILALGIASLITGEFVRWAVRRDDLGLAELFGYALCLLGGVIVSASLFTTFSFGRAASLLTVAVAVKVFGFLNERQVQQPPEDVRAGDLDQRDRALDAMLLRR